MSVEFELLCSALILLTAFIMLMQKHLTSMILTYAWQSAFLAIATFITAINNHNLELFSSVILIIMLKVIVIPLFLRYLEKKWPCKIRYPKTSLVKKPFLLSLVSALCVLFAYHLVLPLRPILIDMHPNTIAIAIAVILLGMLLLITHRKALAHALGFMVMENGIFFAALVATSGMPWILELAISFDVLVATILFGVSFFHITTSIDSLDVDSLNRLREDI